MILLALLLSLIRPAAAQDVGRQYCIIRHEIAHCCGWPYTHPNAILREGCGKLLMPPHDYDSKCNGDNFRITFVPDAEAICGKAKQACAYVGVTPCVIYLQRPITGTHRHL